MRQTAGLLSALGCIAAGLPASAQAADPWLSSPDQFTASQAGAARRAADERLLRNPAFQLSGAQPVAAGGYLTDRGPARFQSDELVLSADRDTVDTVRLAVTSTPVGPAIRPYDGGAYESRGFDLSYTRGWPAVLKFNTGGYDLALSPHAGLGLANGGGSAEAGAMLKVGPSGKKSVEDRLGDLGVKDGRSFGDTGRWYMFAAVSGRAVGLNLTQNQGGDWNRSGWSVDRTSAIIGDGQVGVGWRQGGMQAAFGYVHREIKVQNSPRNADRDVQDSMAAFSLSIRPSW